jgi:putative PIN family toxin of toxin-antitoxin system
MNFDKKIVIDTGTLISASFRIGSIPSQAYLKALREFSVCVSEATFTELETVMRRDKFNKYLSLEDRLSFVELYRKKSTWYKVTESVFDCRDPNDNKFLELALAVKAEIIVSSDEDLYILNPYRNIAILKPAEFLSL